MSITPENIARIKNGQCPFCPTELEFCPGKGGECYAMFHPDEFECKPFGAIVLELEHSVFAEEDLCPSCMDDACPADDYVGVW